jgi:small-conductance mechanosensitive channel
MTQLRVVVTSSLESWRDHAADSELVTQLLREVATMQPTVLTEPALLVLRSGLSDCAAHFEVRVWTAPFEEAESIRSQLAVAVQHALVAASVEAPCHQYEIHFQDKEGKPEQDSGDATDDLARW